MTADLTSSEKDELLNSTKKLFDKDPFVSLSVEKNLITFNTLLNLDNRAVQKILRETAQEELARALKDADTAVQNKIFINMSKRAANMLKEDIEFIGPVREADINEARDHIISTIIRLSQEGDIVISDLWND